jgi:ATP-dependent RNA helicase MSS116
VHRLGRTARAGAKGHGVLILADFETFFLNDKTIRTFDLQDYPAVDAASLASAQNAVASALRQVSDEIKGQAYQAWLGYYNSNLRNLKWNQAALVQNANDYARYCLQSAPDADGTWRAPGLQAKTVGKMGLKGVPGLNIVRGEQGGGRQGGGASRQQGGAAQGKRPQQQQMQRDSVPAPPQVGRGDMPRGRGGPRRGAGGGRGRGARGGGAAQPRGPIAGGNVDTGGW